MALKRQDSGPGISASLSCTRRHQKALVEGFAERQRGFGGRIPAVLFIRGGCCCVFFFPAPSAPSSSSSFSFIAGEGDSLELES